MIVWFFAIMLVTSPIMEVASTTVPPPGPFESAEKSVKAPPSPHNMTAFNSTSTVTEFPSLVKLTCSRCMKGCLKAANKQACFKYCNKFCRKGSSTESPPSTVNCDEQCGNGMCASVPLCRELCPAFCGLGR